MKKINLLGKRFGQLVVIDLSPNSKSKQTCWKCKCDCGNEKIVQGCHLRNGHTTSCGCSWYRYGSEHHSWKGHKEISQRFFKSIVYNAHSRGLRFELNIEDIWKLFSKQHGLCALSGIPLTFPAKHGRIKGTASLDRKDSTLGYTIDNVQWVHSTINQMKWDMPQKDFLTMCEKVYKHNK